MDTGRLEACLERFDLEELLDLLGRNLAELLVEWLPMDQPIFTNENLAKMILGIHGNGILASKPVRNRVVRTLAPKEIESFRALLPKRAQTASLLELAEEVAKAPWNSNPVTRRLLDVLEIGEDLFVTETETQAAAERVEAGERFFELLDYQFYIRQRILSYLHSEIDLAKLVVRMPTGTGKTKTAMHTIIHHYIFDLNKKGLVIWLAHTKELLNQAFDTFCNVWRHIGSGSVTAYKMWNSFTLPVQEGAYDGFLFCGIQKLQGLCHHPKKQELFQKVRDSCVLVVVDEAHRAGAPKTKRVLGELMSKPAGARNRALIGLTATPGRSATDTAENRLFSTMFENKIISIDTELLNRMNLPGTEADNLVPEQDIIKYFQDRRILAKLQRETLGYGALSAAELSQLKTHMTGNGYKDFSAGFLELVGRNAKRNSAIVERLMKLNADGVPTIVFACSVEHGKMLSSVLTLQGVENGHVFGDMAAAERQKVISRFKDREDKLNILINFEVLTTGFDATNIRCVFITRPTNSVVLYSQMIGRGLRGPQMGGNETCLLIDIDDNLNKYRSESEAFQSFDHYWR